MIIGTAGHIDHGKTALVRALTGTDTDRLPEEKKRGITIELGYAFLPLDDGGRISFVDVPGHEKLVRTMVAGASGIDYALLLVAADDGVMPQTIEHLTILSLLGVRRGAAIVTKIDRADASLRLERVAQVQALLEGAGLGDYPVLAVSAQSGEGMDALKALLRAQAGQPSLQDAAAEQAGFRMGLDRAFTLDGIGTVVAGSIAAGMVNVGDMVCLADSPDRHYRVRSLQVHNHAAESSTAGQRCAVGLAGLERNDVARGQTLCDPSIAQMTSRIDVQLTVSAAEAAGLRSGTRVHLHVATRECMATVAILGQLSIAPGASGLAQLVLQEPLVCWYGDRFVLRDASASRTVAGGMVLDTAAPTRYRQTPERLAWLHTQHSTDPAERVQGALNHAPFGLNGRQWLRSNGLKTWPFDKATLADAVFDADNEWVIAARYLADAEGMVLNALQVFHDRLPEDIGPDVQRARRLAAPRMPEALWMRLVGNMVGAGQVARRNGFLHLPGHGEQLRAADKVVAERVLPMLLEGRFEPPWVRDMAANTGLAEAQVRQVLARMAKSGDVFQIVKDLYYHPDAVQQLASLVRNISQQHGAISAANFRDATGLGRKRAIQILEFFDRSGFLRRVGDAHLLRPGGTLFSQAEQC